MTKTSLAGTYSALNFDYNTNPYVNYRAQLAFVQKKNRAGHIQDSLPGLFVLNATKLNYLCLGQLIRVKRTFENATPYILLGPTFNYLINYTPQNDLEPVAKNIQSLTWSLNLGIGVNYRIKKFLFVYEIEYLHDINPVIFRRRVNTQPDVSVYNRALVYSLGIGILL